MQALVSWYKPPSPIIHPFQRLTTEYFQDCVYPEPSRKRRWPKPPRIKPRVSRLDAGQSDFPTATDPSPTISRPLPTHCSSSHRSNQTTHNAVGTHNYSALPQIGTLKPPHSMIQHGEIEYQGPSADRTFVRELKRSLGNYSGGDQIRRHLSQNPPLPSLLDSQNYLPDRISLPSRRTAINLARAALDAQLLLDFVHRPTFDISFDLIYSLDVSDYGEREKRFLPLLYATLAYGCLSKHPESNTLGSNSLSREELVEHG